MELAVVGVLVVVGALVVVGVLVVVAAQLVVGAIVVVGELVLVGEVVLVGELVVVVVEVAVVENLAQSEAVERLGCHPTDTLLLLSLVCPVLPPVDSQRGGSPRARHRTPGSPSLVAPEPEQHPHYRCRTLCHLTYHQLPY